MKERADVDLQFVVNNKTLLVTLTLSSWCYLTAVRTVKEFSSQDSRQKGVGMDGGWKEAKLLAGC